jgi:uncharacterized protein (TIGR02145 family)
VTDVPPCGSTITYNDYPYKTVGIGTQCWMAENLRTRKYRDGTDIQFDASGGPTGDGQGQTWGALTSGAHTLYAHDSTATPSNLTSYGYLYNWYAVNNWYPYNDSRKLCPPGWDVPRDWEWTILTTYLGGESVAGGKMKSTLLWNSPNTGADNSSGFSALPGGFRDNLGGFNSNSNSAFFWSNTEGDSYGFWRRSLGIDNGSVFRDYSYVKRFGASVRCLRD